MQLDVLLSKARERGDLKPRLACRLLSRHYWVYLCRQDDSGAWHAVPAECLYCGKREGKEDD